MRRLVLALVLANVLVFGWNRGWFVGAGEAPPPAAEENAQRLRPVPLSRLEVRDKPPPAESPPAALLPFPRRAASPAAPSQPPAVRPESASQSLAAPAQGVAAQAPPAQPTQAQPTQAQPTQAQPTQAPPTQAQPTQAQPTQAQPTPTPAPAPGDAVPTPGALDARPDRAAEASVPPPVVAAACRAFAPIDEERAAALRSALEQSGARVEARRIEQGASYLVYLPPADSVAEAQQRLVELRRIGRDDAFVIQDGPMRLAISLALFRYESAARAMVEQLVRAGETRALVAPRPPIQVRIALQARWAQAEAAAIATMLGAQFDAPARDCD